MTKRRIYYYVICLGENEEYPTFSGNYYSERLSLVPHDPIPETAYLFHGRDQAQEKMEELKKEREKWVFGHRFNPDNFHVKKLWITTEIEEL